MSPAPRTAVLVPGFRLRRGMLFFDEQHRADVARWKPQAVAGFLDQIMHIQAAPTHAIVAFSSPGCPLTDADRDRLWRRFHVPIFEQIIAADRRLLAYECEAHSALHVVCPPEEVPAGEVRRGRCRCGKDADLLVPEPVQRTLTVTRSESVCPPSPVATI
jgi:hypothetical protein